jgi:hypothetical protein
VEYSVIYLLAQVLSHLISHQISTHWSWQRLILCLRIFGQSLSYKVANLKTYTSYFKTSIRGSCDALATTFGRSKLIPLLSLADVWEFGHDNLQRNAGIASDIHQNLHSTKLRSRMEWSMKVLLNNSICSGYFT